MGFMALGLGAHDLRVMVFSTHTTEQIDCLLVELKALVCAVTPGMKEAKDYIWHKGP